MIQRILFLAVILQCGGPQDFKASLPGNYEATLVKYVSGAGGGKGVLFRIHFNNTLPGIDSVHFEANGETLKAAVFREGSGTVVEGSKFYALRKRAEGESDLPETRMPLFEANHFKALLEIHSGNRVDTLIITDFKELDAPPHP